MPASEWNPILLWHITRDEFLLRDFLVNWLYPQFEDGALRVRADDVEAFLDTVAERGGVTEHDWSPATRHRVAAGLLKAAVDFGQLRGTVNKEFASYHLPERSFIYILHALAETTQSAAKIVELAGLAHVPDGARGRGARAPPPAPVPQAQLRVGRLARPAHPAVPDGARTTRRPADDGTAGPDAPAHQAGPGAHPEPPGSATQDQRLRLHALRDLPLRAPRTSSRCGPRSTCSGRGSSSAASASRGSRSPSAWTWRCAPSARSRSGSTPSDRSGTDIVVDTVHEILAQEGLLEQLVVDRLPPGADPLRDVVFINCGREPCSRSTGPSRLLEQLHGRVTVPTVLFYPGELETRRPGSSSWVCSKPSTTTDRGSSDGGIVHGRRTDDQGPLRQRHRPQHRRGHQGRPAR